MRRKPSKLHCFSYILKPVNPAALKKNCSKLLKTLPESSPAAVITSLPSYADQETDKFVQNVQQYITEHLESDGLNRNSIAAFVHMNPDYLSCLFHTKFHQTLSSYLNTARIDRAKDLLLAFLPFFKESAKKPDFQTALIFISNLKKHGPDPSTIPRTVWQVALLLVR